MRHGSFLMLAFHIAWLSLFSNAFTLERRGNPTSKANISIQLRDDQDPDLSIQCSLQTCCNAGGSPSKRNLPYPPDGPPGNVSHQRRATGTFSKRVDADQFMATYANVLGGPGVEAIVPCGDPNPTVDEGLGTSVFRTFGSEAFGYCPGIMIGCTAVIVVSDSAVYMGHLFEGGTWMKPEFIGGNVNAGTNNPTFTLATFRNTVTTFFTNPQRTNSVGDQVAVPLSAYKNYFKNRNGRIYIMTPQNYYNNLQQTSPANFPQQLALLQDLLVQYTGIDYANHKVRLYNALLARDTMRAATTAVGKALYLYAPGPPKQQAVYIERWQAADVPKPV